MRILNLAARLRKIIENRLSEGDESGGAEYFAQQKDSRPLPLSREIDPLVLKIKSSMKVLEISELTNEPELQNAYRKLCKKYHPDRFHADDEKGKLATELMSKINDAYNFLLKAFEKE